MLTQHAYRSPAIIARSTLARSADGGYLASDQAAAAAAATAATARPTAKSTARSHHSRATGRGGQHGGARKARRRRHGAATPNRRPRHTGTNKAGLSPVARHGHGVIHSPIHSTRSAREAPSPLDRALAAMRRRRERKHGGSTGAGGEAADADVGAGLQSSGRRGSRASSTQRGMSTRRSKQSRYAQGYAGFRPGKQCGEVVEPARKSSALVAATRQLTHSLSHSLFPTSSVHHREDHTTRSWKGHNAAVGVDTVANPTYHRRKGDIPGYGGFSQFLSGAIAQHVKPFPRVTGPR